MGRIKSSAAGSKAAGRKQEAVQTGGKVAQPAKPDQKLLAEIRDAASEALKEFPSDAETKALSATGRRFLARYKGLLEEGTRAASWDNARLKRYAGDIDLVQAVNDTIVVFQQKDDNGGGGGAPEKSCLGKYNDCMNEHNCEETTFCICCIPCGIIYGKCVLALIRPELSEVFSPAQVAIQ